ncbi:hypothetical protein EPUL_001568 [Erysiphe pulchra]|uniref:Reverse transcriptase domain-containing protein n=1 Tax=Erysiphe pulchra TaxID=225359 RepID=A0A2S4Q0N8_9PEZI|nr:hypothetical protein EPUL_001568 [Erysiphe pulchra]
MVSLCREQNWKLQPTGFQYWFQRYQPLSTVVDVSKSMLADEIERFCPVRPAYLKLYGRNKSEAPHRTWLAYFPKAPRAEFRVFDESGIFCKRCNWHHPAKNCSRAPSCANWGSTNYSVDTCMAATKCRNYGGPHRADSHRCLARPNRSGVPTKEQMKTYRQMGEREYQAVQRARIAEENAATTGRIDIDLTSSQRLGDISSPENSQATPVEGLLSPPGRSQFHVNKRRKGGTTQDIALARACELRINTNSYFDLNIPYGVENVRPQAVTYIRKDPNRLSSLQKLPLSPIGDYCWVEVISVMFLNVYKAPHDPIAVQPLLSWTLKSRTVAIGDFNSVYWAWQPTANTFYGQGQQIEKWAEEHSLTCLNIGEPTHRAGNTLDLAWTNIKQAMAWLPQRKESTGKKKIEDSKSPKDTFKLMRWAAPRNASLTPPLRHEGKFISDQAERAHILRDCLLARFTASDDLPPCTLSEEERIPWSEELTELEVRTCTIGSGNTSPGADGISVELLAACWNYKKLHVMQLFSACLKPGYHPLCFRLAPSVKGWRPTSLISCLGKGLERLLAKRMSHLAIVCDVVGHQQFWALPKRSAIDLVSCVVHDIEEAGTRGWAATMVTIDMQGAFDAVLHNRLIWRVQDHDSQNRFFDGPHFFLKIALVCGVPQGSPISPHLFLLYLAEPMRSGNTICRFSYVNDIEILGFGRTVTDSAAAAQKEVDKLTHWAHQNAVLFDSEKSEVVQFPGRQKEDHVGIEVTGRLIKPAKHISWLGIYLDSRLTFKHNVSTWCGKALKLAQHMRRLNSVSRGAAPKALIMAMNACVIPIATYRSEVWWPGLFRPKANGLAKSIYAEYRWVPRHSRIIGNEVADAEARTALRDLLERHTQPGFITLAYLRRLMQQKRQLLVEKWWSEVCPARYQDLDLKMRRRKPPELSLPWRLLHKLLAARTGHGDFATYHRRLNNIDAILECVCGRETTLTHFIRYRRHANQMRKLQNGMNMGTFRRQLLGHDCCKNFKKFVRIQVALICKYLTHSLLDARKVINYMPRIRMVG